MNWRPSNALLWFGVGGGAGAFVVQFVAGLAFSFAQCNQTDGRWHLPIRTWQVALAGGGALIALASTAVSVLIFLRTFRIGDVFGEERRGDGHPPPLGRIHFLALIALTVNLLILPIIIMDGVGTGIHSFCQQT
jgi:hypothetical protein